MPKPAHLLSLSLRDFRNHRATRIAPGPSAFVVLTGPNGAGKTNILEAASLLAIGKGLRGGALSQMAAAQGAGGFATEAELSPDPALPAVTIASRTDPAAPERRQLRVNGAPAALSTLAEWCSILWLTPAMDRLFADTASARRRFLDRLVLALNPAHGGHATRYEAAMRARTRLLTGNAPPDPHWLDALEREMEEHGAAIGVARADTVAALGEALAAIPPGAPFPAPALALEGGDGHGLAGRLRAARGLDAAAGRATSGPHRADLLVTHRESGLAAALASTGEQKALLISTLLAHAGLVAERTGRTPLLLLDEAAAHLDPARRRALWGQLALLGGQSWLTGTDATLFEGLDAARYAVREGKIGT